MFVEPEEVPSYVLKAHSRFISHVNKSENLNGLKFIGIVTGLKTDSGPYLWHETVNPNSTIHEGNRLNEFSYSVLKLDNFSKTNKQLKNNQDRWISLILHISEMTEEEAKNIFDHEPVFQEVLQILKLDNLISDKRREYLHSEKIRRREEKSNRSKFEERWKIGEEIFEKISDELTLEICQKIELEIKRRRNRNEAIVIKEIVGPIIDEHFDDQNIIKIDPEKERSIIIDTLKRHQISLPYDYIDLRKRWTHEEIEGLKEDLRSDVKDWPICKPTKTRARK
jgi:predicted RNA-binding protein with RPS1 domain